MLRGSCDLVPVFQLDFAEPLGYVAPQYEAKPTAASQQGLTESTAPTAEGKEDPVEVRVYSHQRVPMHGERARMGGGEEREHLTTSTTTMHLTTKGLASLAPAVQGIFRAWFSPGWQDLWGCTQGGSHAHRAAARSTREAGQGSRGTR